MENVKEGSGGAKSNNENPNSASENGTGTGSNRQLPRTPFTNLSQVDADLALARTLQEQERAYMILRMNGEGSSDYGSSEAGSFVQDNDFEDEDEDDEEDDDADEDGDGDEDEDEDAFAVHADLEGGNNSNTSPNNELDSSAFSCDEAFARALQDAEDRELAARMMALTGGGLDGFNNAWDAEDTGDDDNSNSQDTWEEVDPDELSYEELIALGEVVGTESRGLSADTIASLPSVTYKAKDTQDAEQCVICRVEYEEEDALIVLSCKHAYHSECINNWLQINKVCPVCSAEVCSTSGGR